MRYARAMGITGVIWTFISIIVYQAINAYSNIWLTFWTEDPYLKNQSLVNTTEYSDTNNVYIIVYTVMGLVQSKMLNQKTHT